MNKGNGLRIVNRAYDILGCVGEGNRDRWTYNAQARDRFGDAVDWFNALACRWCLTGGLLRAKHELKASARDLQDAYEIIYRAVAMLGFHPHLPAASEAPQIEIALINFNDHPEIDYADIKKIMDHAVVMATATRDPGVLTKGDRGYA